MKQVTHNKKRVFCKNSFSNVGVTRDKERNSICKLTARVREEQPFDETSGSRGKDRGGIWQQFTTIDLRRQRDPLSRGQHSVKQTADQKATAASHRRVMAKKGSKWDSTDMHSTYKATTHNVMHTLLEYAPADAVSTKLLNQVPNLLH